MKLSYREESCSDLDGTSKIDVIREELGKVLAEDFTNERAFYHNQLLTSAPNPCIDITGPGLFGLPLSSRDVQAIITAAKSSSQGGQANSNEFNAWQIESNQIRFTNEEWSPFLQNTISPAVLRGLGVKEPRSAARLEFSRLLVCGPGSSLTCQGLEEPNLAFASILILLPSKHAGGEFHLSSGTQTQTVSTSPKSMFKTYMISWYTGVTCEMKPIISGYRLGLLYNFIYTGDKESMPRLPNTDPTINRLKAAFGKWLQVTASQEAHSKNFLVSVLNENCNVLDYGLDALSGRDAYIVSSLRAIGKEMGFAVFIGSVKYRVRGAGCDDTCFDQVDEVELTLEHVVDLEGKPVAGTAFHEAWSVDNWVLVPENPFDDLEPDSKNFEEEEGFGLLEHFYTRTGVLLAPKDHVNAIVFKRAGMDYAVQKLERPTDTRLNEKDRNTMLAMIRGLEVDLEGEDTDQRTYSDIISYAFRWRSVDVWEAALLKYNNTPELLDIRRLEDAKAFFTFEDMQPCFRELLRKEQPLRIRMNFIDLVRRAFGDDQPVEIWCKEQRAQAYFQFVNPCNEDITLLMNAAQQYGIAFLSEVVLSSLERAQGAFEFMVHFIDELRKYKALIPSGISINHPQTVGWDTLMDQCLNILIDQMDVTNELSQGKSVSSPLHQVQHANSSSLGCPPVTQLISVYRRCLSPRRDQLCGKITDLLLSIPGSPTQLFTDLYTPLLSKLRTLCDKLKIDMTAPPLARLLRTLVELYFQHVLKVPPINLAKIKKIGCGCNHCKNVDRFIVNTNMKQWSIQLKPEENIQAHIKPRLNSAQGVLSYAIIPGNPPTLRILKLPEILAAQKWQETIPAAKTFLSSYIGDDSTIAQLMGVQYGDVQRILQGLRPLAGLGMRKRKASTEASSAGEPKKKRARSDHGRDNDIMDLTV